MGSIPGLGRSSEVRNGNPLQYSCLENSMDSDVKVWQAVSMGLQRNGHNWATEQILHSLFLEKYSLDIWKLEIKYQEWIFKNLPVYLSFKTDFHIYYFI